MSFIDFLDAIASHETGLLVGWLVGGLVMLFENTMKYTIIKDMITSIDQGQEGLMNIVPELLPSNSDNGPGSGTV